MNELTSTLKALKLSASQTAATYSWSRLLTGPKSRHLSDQLGMSSGQSRADPIEIQDEIASPHIRPGNEGAANDPGLPPKYYDVHLRCLMYRGPGYEEFPAAFVSDPSFQEAVDEWEQRQQRQPVGARSETSLPDVRRRARPTTNRHPGHSVASQSLNREVPEPGNYGINPSLISQRQFEDACLAQALQIFPNIEHEFVREKCKEWSTQHAPDVDLSIIADAHATAEIIAAIAELDTYPEQTKKRKRASSTAKKPLGHIEWSQDAPMPRSLTYLHDGLRLLADHFRHVPTHEIQKKLRMDSVFDTYKHFASMESNFHSMPVKPYRRLRVPRVSLEQKYVYVDPYPNNRPAMEYPYLVNEFQAAKKSWHEDRRRSKRKKDEEDAEAANFKEHADAGMLIECQCCFDDEIPINRAVPCDGEQVHFYCHSCVNNQAASLIGQMQYELKCMYSGSIPCTAPISKSTLRQALDAKTMSKLEGMQQNAEIGQADIEGLEECPFCDYKAVCVSVDIDREFLCGNSDCAKTSCRLCHNITHIPLTCEEAKQQREKDRGATLRHDVEEAMSKALMRNCPNRNCKVPIIKEYGCNKMVCGKCHTMLCYVCGKDITKGRGGGYEHFSVPGAACKLHDDHEPQREARQVADAQKEAINRLRRENPDIEESALVVPQGPPPTRRSRAPQFFQEDAGIVDDIQAMIAEWPEDFDPVLWPQANPHAPARPFHAAVPNPNGAGPVRHFPHNIEQQANIPPLGMNRPFRNFGVGLGNRGQDYGVNHFGGMDNPQPQRREVEFGGNGEAAGRRFGAAANGLFGEHLRPEDITLLNQATNRVVGMNDGLGLEGLANPWRNFTQENIPPVAQPGRNAFWGGNWFPRNPAVPPWLGQVQPNGDGRHLNL